MPRRITERRKKAAALHSAAIGLLERHGSWEEVRGVGPTLMASHDQFHVSIMTPFQRVPRISDDLREHVETAEVVDAQGVARACPRMGTFPERPRPRAQEHGRGPPHFAISVASV